MWIRKTVGRRKKKDEERGNLENVRAGCSVP